MRFGNQNNLVLERGLEPLFSEIIELEPKPNVSTKFHHSNKYYQEEFTSIS